MAQFTNQAQLSYNNQTVNSNIATGEILEALSATKTALSTTYGPDDNITYVISALNSAPTALTGISVSDDLGGYTFGAGTVYPLSYVENSARLYINGVLQPTPAVTAGPPLSFTGITLPANSNMVLVYETETNQFAPQGATDSITNTATLTGNGIPTPVTATVDVTPTAEPDLTITKSIEPATVTENGTVTYRFVIQNYGNTAADADANVAVSDLFDPILSDITVTVDGATVATPGTYTYNEATGQFNTVPGQIVVPAATYTQDPTTGAFTVTPGVSVLTVTGTI